jgi:putative membrane protein
MKKLAISIAATALLLHVPAFAQSVGEKTGINSALDISPTTADFVKEAATSDMLEIAAAKIAEQKGDADDKKFAGQMISDHTKTSADLKGMVSTGEVKAAIPDKLDASSEKKLDKLRATKAQDFASEYAPMQVSAHKEAVSLFERYSKSGDNAKLKDWAGKTLPALQHHLEMAQALDKVHK